jgi:hypothetical protein
MSSAEQQPEALDVVVGADGSGLIDASQLARLGLPPGSHLSVVPGKATAPEHPRRQLRGALASDSSPSWEDFEAASEQATGDVEARYQDGGAWDLSR